MNQYPIKKINNTSMSFKKKNLEIDIQYSDENESVN